MMFLRGVWLAGLLSLSAIASAQTGAMGAEEARHLLSRTGFTPAAAEISQWRELSRREAVERLLSQARQTAVTPVPEEVSNYQRPEPRQSMSPEEIKNMQQARREEERMLRDWWLGEMLITDSPLSERMTLFWHNHFVSSIRKVRSPALMHRQNALFRREALGSFARLLHAAAKDPAMVIYLDAATSRKEAPNENFAREVMELFTLGEGRYTERDIKEAARAFTGWGIDRASGDFVVRRAQHDDGIKTVLGTTGRLDGDAVLDVLLNQPATAEFITAKLWREFISPAPDASEVSRIARRFHDSGYDIRVALRELFLTPAFWAPENRGTLVKSPVELVVGSIRVLGLVQSSLGPVKKAQVHLNQMGQVLFAPPNVKGWPGGPAWIDSSTLLKRRDYLARLAGSAGQGALQQASQAVGLDSKFVLLGSLQPQAGARGIADWLADAQFQVK